MPSIYISGPMHGHKDFNIPAFIAAEAWLKAQGWTVFSPATNVPENDVGGDTHIAIAKGFDFKAAFRWDVEKVIEANAILMLKGWHSSRGALAEHAVAIAVNAYDPEYRIMYQ